MCLLSVSFLNNSSKSRPILIIVFISGRQTQIDEFSVKMQGLVVRNLKYFLSILKEYVVSETPRTYGQSLYIHMAEGPNLF